MHRKAQLVVTSHGQIEVKPAREEQDGAAERHGVLSKSILVIAALAVIYTLYLGKEILLPLALAIVLKLLLQPAMRLLQQHMRFPGPLAALLLIIAVLGAIAAVAFTISVPASGWIQKAPHSLPLLKEKLSILRQPLDYLQVLAKPAGEHNGIDQRGRAVGQTVTVKQGSGLASYLATGTTTTLSRFFTTMVMLFFLLVSGDRLLRGFVEVLPRFKDKRTAVEIASETVENICGYLLTITMMNTVVGIATGIAMQLCGLGDPMLWGVLAFLLNYVPVLGPMTGVVMFFVAGLRELRLALVCPDPSRHLSPDPHRRGRDDHADVARQAVHPEPSAGDRFVVLLAYALGIPGALLAVPLLAIFKIIADRIDPLKPIGHVIGS